MVAGPSATATTKWVCLKIGRLSFSFSFKSHEQQVPFLFVLLKHQEQEVLSKKDTGGLLGRGLYPRDIRKAPAFVGRAAGLRGANPKQETRHGRHGAQRQRLKQPTNVSLFVFLFLV